MKLDKIKQQAIIFDRKSLTQIKGGTNETTTSTTAIIGVDVDVI